MRDYGATLEPMTLTTDFRQQFVEFAIKQNALCFGEFKTKAGRLSPYFFNSGLFGDGASLAGLTRFYAEAAIASGIQFDMLFGPAYKGITLGAGMAIALAGMGRNVPFAFNRKEAKDHGEGGLIVGAPLNGRVLIIDDVISDGASKHESVQLIRAAGATPAGVLIALDRQEVGTVAGDTMSAAQAFHKNTGVPVFAVATLADIVNYLQQQSGERDKIAQIERYRQQFGATL